jgi:hypothetical protein
MGHAPAASVILTALSSLPARCATRDDLAIRCSIERVVFEVRTEIVNVCQLMADKCGEPPLDERGRGGAGAVSRGDRGPEGDPPWLSE